jgi:hypothetical protein
MAMNLVNYGIQTETSDIRIHVCSVIGYAYVYITEQAKIVVAARTEAQCIAARQLVNGKSVITAQGYLVTPDEIPGCNEVKIPGDISASYPIEEKDNTTLKGSQAVAIVKECILRHVILLPARIDEITDIDMQIKGTDIIVQSHLRIQVKCDRRGGRRTFGGTGNLYLQTAEINPLKAH